MFTGSPPSRRTASATSSAVSSSRSCAPAPVPARSARPASRRGGTRAGSTASRSGLSRHCGPVPARRTRDPHFFRTNTTPVYFVGATPFNLLGLDRWVRNFHHVTYYDGWDGAHPRVFTPQHKPFVEFESGEEINNYLLRHPEVQAYMAKRPGRPNVAMVFFDEETQGICEEPGYDLILPRRRCASTSTRRS